VLGELAPAFTVWSRQVENAMLPHGLLYLEESKERVKVEMFQHFRNNYSVSYVFGC
jgi:hypothetical protein